MVSKGTRPPAVAGLFYPSDTDELFESIHRCFTHPLGPGAFPRRDKTIRAQEIECIIVPHAGYEYSGPVAAHSYTVAANFFSTFSEEPATVLIFGPNHYGIGSGVAASPSSSWSTPLGEVQVNQELSSKIAKNSGIVDIDELAHSKEHSIEVQIPFLQVASNMKRDLNIVPVSMMLQDFETAKQIAKASLAVMKAERKPFLVVGSSDLTHYEPDRQARSKDLKLLQKVEQIDLGAFYTVLEQENLTSCGYGAIATVMEIAKNLGRKAGELLKYATSGDVTGDKSSVVGYPSVHFI